MRKELEYACPWFEVERKDVALGEPRGEEPFFTVKTEPYVAVLALTVDRRVPFVQTYRPAVEEVVTELPSGRFEGAVRRELLEETGCRAGTVRHIATLYVDTGRMQTRQWAFFAPGVEVVARPASPDEDLALRFVPEAELRPLVANGDLAASAHLSVICVAWAQRLLAV